MALVLLLASSSPARATRLVEWHGLSAGDLDGIRAAFEAQRHAARPVGGGHLAHNPGQGWRIEFDGRAFTAVPDGGGWTWGLELERYGRAGSEVVVERPDGVSCAGERVTYSWGLALEEWYVNDRRGLEHGYTLRRPPAGGADPLIFTLAVRGALRPEVAAGGRDVRFVDASGAAVVSYAGLSAFDADGRELEAAFELVGERLRLSVDERGARYPLTIDPIAQQAYLKASNTDAEDRFGWSVAASGDTVVVGAWAEDSAASGVNGNQADDSANNCGAAYVFVRQGSGWVQQAYLKPSNARSGLFFGWSVALSGDTVVVGAIGEPSGATGINGNQNDTSAVASGAAYVYERSGTIWTQTTYLKASNTGILDFFGWSVAVSDDFIVVGAPAEDSAGVGVNGLQNSNATSNSGAAYLFVRNGTSWLQSAYLKASNTGVDDEFGFDVAVSRSTVVVSADQESSASTGIGGDQADDSAFGAGAVYVFVPAGTTWGQQAYVKASNTGGGDLFGFSVALDGDLLAVSAQREDSGATGVNGNQADDGATDAGAVYLLERSGTTWSQQAYLKASNTDADDLFGSSLAMSGSRLVVGASRERSAAAGIDGDQDDDSAPDAGAAYVFARIQNVWSQRAYLKASNTDAGDLFGAEVALAGDTAVVGARAEASGATGVNGNAFDDGAVEAGAAYVFDVSELPTPVAYCTGKTSSLGCVPFVDFTGTPSATSTAPFRILAEDVIPNEAAVLLYSFKKANLDFHGGKLCVKLPFQRVLPLAIAKPGGLPPCTGMLKRDFSSTIQLGGDPLLTAGQTVFTQWRQRDPADPAGFGDSLTDALVFTIGP